MAYFGRISKYFVALTAVLVHSFPVYAQGKSDDNEVRGYIVFSGGSGKLDGLQTFDDGTEWDYYMEDGLVFSVAVGADFGNFMLEAQVNDAQGELDKIYELVDGERVFVANRDGVGGRAPGVELESALVNVWVTPFEGIPVWEAMYVGGGLGLGRTRFMNLEDDVLTGIKQDEQTEPAWQWGAGFRFAGKSSGLFAGTTMGFGYRHTTYGAFQDVSREIEHENVFIEFGLTY